MSMGAPTASSPPSSPLRSPSFGSYEQTQKAIDAMRNKAPIEDIDFTVHVMEDGTEVSTLERVCRGICLSPSSSIHAYVSN